MEQANKPGAPSLRRSFVLSSRLVDEVRRVAPAALRTNLNRIVTMALEEYVARRRQEAFEAAMAEMAADPAIRAECTAIARDFEATLEDGFKRD